MIKASEQGYCDRFHFCGYYLTEFHQVCESDLTGVKYQTRVNQTGAFFFQIHAAMSNFDGMFSIFFIWTLLIYQG